MPVPKFFSLAELNGFMAACDAADDDRHIARRPETVGAAAAAEVAHLRALPTDDFDVTTTLHPIVDTKARICVRQALYSVPAGLARRRVEVRLGARRFDVVAAGKVVATHERSLHKGTEDLVLDHYLEILTHKPGAMPGSIALAQARASGAFGPTHDAFWAAARRRLGDGAGTRALIGVLLLHRTSPAESVIAAMAAALRIDSVDPEVVAVEARRHADAATTPATVVVPIGARLGQRPAPGLGAYDELLAGAGR